MLRLKRLGTSRYATHDERFLVENDDASWGELYDAHGYFAGEGSTGRSWFVYDATKCDIASAGLPDAVYEGDTLRLCREFIEQQYAREMEA